MTQEAHPFEQIVVGQLPTQEQQIAVAADSMKSFMRTGDGGASLTRFTELYLELLAACGFDEDRAASVVKELIDG